MSTNTDSTPQPARRGRKRDGSRDTAILDAALDVLAEVGYEHMTMDMVAARAKAGKATVYRSVAAVGPWIEVTRRLIGRAIDRGEVRPDVDINLLSHVVPWLLGRGSGCRSPRRRSRGCGNRSPR